MQVRVMTHIQHHSLSDERRLILAETLCDLAREDPDSDMVSHAILFVNSNDESIPIFLSIIRNPYQQEEKIVMANDCRSFDEAREMQSMFTMAAEEHFGADNVKSTVTTWTNPLLN